MKCPFCGSNQDKVLESRTLSDGEAIRRRRECIDCEGRFTSYERIEEKPLMVIKTDGRKEFFQKEKMLKGVLRSVEKRPVPYEFVEEIVEDITNELHTKPEREVESRKIGEYIMNRLSEIDQIAYVRFASVYKKFKDVGEFIEEIKNM
ncbi:MAG: transcriptional regulator NrdR [Candidatus Margulisbacteria bacterium GWF2_35_9]|nr:MAG: transcriptional regulator NrdR [Candidatus Margulisbacteria bacterium GWF2_35_9]